MTFEDGLRHGVRAILAYRQRSALTMLGITIGIASVILLTSIGEGARVYMLDKFTQFGTNLIAVNPGQTETSGIPGMMGGTTNPLTIADAEAIGRMPGVMEMVSFISGTANVEFGERSRDVVIYGVTAGMPAVLQFGVRQGRFLPPGDPRRGSPVSVLGPKLKQELFGNANALGEHVRIAGQRFLVIGIMEPKGQFLGFDLDDSAYIPLAIAQSLFNKQSLMEIDITFNHSVEPDTLAAHIQRLLIERHDGHQDFTITTQTDMLATTDRILRIVSLAVAGIGAISLLVGAIGILTMMWISVSERTSEIGLVKAMGATHAQILWLFLGEAILLSTLGGIAGLAAALGIGALLRLALPGFPISTPLPYVVLALALSFSVGVLSGILPARRAASLDPIQALAAE